MRVVIQRVNFASLQIENEVYSKINQGLLVLLGIENEDTQEDIDWLSNKIINLRIFNDENGVMNLSLKDINADIMLVSQFTLFASTKKGNRPSYICSAKPEISKPMYEKFISKLENDLGKQIATGVFGADMKINLENDGPVTIIIDSKNKK